VAEGTRLVDLVQQAIDGFLAERTQELDAIAPDLGELVGTARGMLGAGKRFRALFCYWGWQSSASAGDGFDPLVPGGAPSDLPGVVLAASALEVFHAAALVHDDLMDNSDTRRGEPSAHRAFEASHAQRDWAGPSAGFGRSAALLLGDLLLGWSDELFDRGCSRIGSRAAALAARAEFNRMRTEVTAGQYLDILEEVAWQAHPESESLQRAHRVIVWKSAKYSVEAPLVIGAALGGAGAVQLDALRAFGLPLGVAYQLRDDLLGVFGDPAITGKPAGDDLREGKRTVLVALARQAMAPQVRRTVDELIGDPDLDASQVELLRTTIRESGAADQVEALIARNVAAAMTAMADAPLSASSREQLADLADRVTRRTS
jgi:geranylgeranyl diphosphate synthase type I